MQTIIVFDWDDSLFPTSYLLDDLKLKSKVPLSKQVISREMLWEVRQGLKELQERVVQLLRLASKRGKVIIVTLAKSPWVAHSCANFFPEVGKLLKQLDINVVYAQDGVAVDYDKQRMMTTNDVEKFYARMKGDAIAREVEAFYSQYEGQSWKNIISIGDSNFERLGTMMMTRDYMRDKGMLSEGAMSDIQHLPTTVVIRGHVLKVRTKTFKMLDAPTISELTAEQELLQKWLPRMVSLDAGFDVDLSELDDPDLIQGIEVVLNGKDR